MYNVRSDKDWACHVPSKSAPPEAINVGGMTKGKTGHSLHGNMYVLEGDITHWWRYVQMVSPLKGG